MVYQRFELHKSSLTVICPKTSILHNRKMEEVPENDGFVEDEEDDEVDIDEIEEEEDFDENNESSPK